MLTYSHRYHSRVFKRHLALKKNGRLTAVPQLDLPNILVDDEEQRAKKKKSVTPYGSSLPPNAPGSAPLHSPTSFLSPTRNSAGSGHQKSPSNVSADLTLQTNAESYGAHPLSMPRMGAGGEGSRASGFARGDDSHQSTHSAFSFELQQPGSGASSARTSYRNSNRNSRSNSAVSPIQMSQILDDSIWVESIRRSATMKRPRQGW